MNLKNFKIKQKHYKIYDSSLFLVKATSSMIEHNFTLIFQTFYYTLKGLSNTEKNLSWKSTGLSAEKLNTPTTTDYSLSVLITWYRYSIFCLILKGSCSE